MSALRRPATHPDIEIADGDGPVTWPVGVRINGAPVDFADYEWRVVLTDNNELLGNLEYSVEDPHSGEALIALSEELIDKMKRYSTWQLREVSTFHGTIMQGRLVKVA